MPAKEDRRSALVHPPFLVLIAPNGTLRRVPIARNMRSRLVIKDGGVWVLREDAKAAGWEMLRTHVSEKVYDQIAAHLKAEQTRPFHCGKLDRKLLPKICKDRRAASVITTAQPKQLVQEIAELRAQLAAAQGQAPKA